MNKLSNVMWFFILFIFLISMRKVEAQDKATTTDRVIFTADNALWSVPSQGGDRLLLATLPWTSEELTNLQVTGNGKAMLAHAKGFTAWAPLAKDASTSFTLLPCIGQASLSKDGNQVVCQSYSTKQIAIYTMRPKKDVTFIPFEATGPLFFSNTPGHIITYGKGATLVSVSLSSEKKITNHRPDSLFQISPNGKRGIGTYAEELISIVYSFGLGHKGAKRTLMHAAQNVGFSADSNWVVVQQDSDACAVKAIGGQYMCWVDYVGQSISSKGQGILLSRSSEKRNLRTLYVGNVAGTSARKPSMLITNVGKIACFWPLPTDAVTP